MYLFPLLPRTSWLIHSHVSSCPFFFFPNFNQPTTLLQLLQKFKYFSFSLQKTGQVGVKVTFDWRIDGKADPSPDSENKNAFLEMVKSLPADDARFIVFDFTETKDDGRQIKKLLLIKWCPDAVNFKIKPVIGATYQTLKEKLTGLGKDIQATDPSDLDYAVIAKQLA